MKNWNKRYPRNVMKAGWCTYMYVLINQESYFGILDMIFFDINWHLIKINSKF